ncbi:A/G-specific adenine glycosylase [Sphingomonas oleivorans]|uniref:Adenine DNA glycosylase n=1 Tax=Sphingomonas oleivorans TaxID=1735121 RepID=A0A2T5FXY5_9SPHN|nr:A/G-specific adenine glycosylase [Sphingomonas oleivorans]PTQ11000.1 A/G-specific adenine glycosylase [Sphingomonas oleivorans]
MTLSKAETPFPQGQVSAALLAWYDRNARRLPWRAGPDEAADPYRVWLSEIMLQQTTVAAVKPYFAAFTTRWPTVEALAAAEESAVMAAWAGLGYYARARNLIACARVVAADHGGHFPDEEAALRALPGLGRYTAAAVAAIAFGRRAVVVDANVERVVARLFALSDPLPGARDSLYALADSITPDMRAGDFAQAMMDLGATICTPRNPACAICPLRDGCAAARTGTTEAFPVKAAKKAKPVRRGTAFWLERDGTVLLVRRPAKGLLGGMMALPTGEWTAADPGLAGAPTEAQWRPAGTVSHIFTHFALELAVVVARGDAEGIWWPIERIEQAGLPTIFAKAAASAQSVDP